MEYKNSNCLRNIIFQSLKNDIEQNKLEEGQKLPTEKTLCEYFNVSRTTIRSALQQLEAQGLIHTIQGAGSFVSTKNNESHHINLLEEYDIQEILEYRLVIEKGVIRLAAKKITDEQIKLLEENYLLMRENVTDIKNFSKIDYEFHHLIAEFSNNQLLIDADKQIKHSLETALDKIVAILGCGIGLKYHQKIIEALKSHDIEICEKLMEEHIQVTIDGINNALNDTNITILPA